MTKILLVLFCFCFSFEWSNATDNTKKTISTGFSLSLFKDVDIRDASVAVKLWGEEFLGSMGMDIKVYENTKDIVEALNENSIGLISLTIIEYFEIKDKVKITPYTLTSSNGKPGSEFILVVRENSKINKLTDLFQKQVHIPSGSQGNLVDMWLAVKLSENKLNYGSFFTQINKVDKPSQAVLPVFFKQSDACVVPEEAFNTMLELNPQLRTELKVIDKSPYLLNGLMCINNSLRNDIREAILKGTESISSSSSGRQILKLFKSDGIIRFDEKYLEETKTLYKKYIRLNSN